MSTIIDNLAQQYNRAQANFIAGMFFSRMLELEDVAVPSKAWELLKDELLPIDDSRD